MYGSNNWGSIWTSPGWPWKLISFFSIFAQQMLDRTWNLPHSSWDIKQVHFVVFISHFIGDATCPCFDLVESEFFLIVARFAHVHVFVGRKTPWSTLIKAGYKHDKATVKQLANLMVSILSRFDDFVFEEKLFVSVDCLLRAVIPARIDPFLPSPILPGPEYLCDNWFSQVIWIPNMNPIALGEGTKESVSCCQV